MNEKERNRLAPDSATERLSLGGLDAVSELYPECPCLPAQRRNAATASAAGAMSFGSS